MLWNVGAWWRAMRRQRLRPAELRRLWHRDQPARIGLTLTEFSRDRLRTRWLRLRRD